MYNQETYEAVGFLVRGERPDVDLQRFCTQFAERHVEGEVLAEPGPVEV